MARFRAASAMAPIPFDKHGVPGTIEIVDDFLGIDETEIDGTSAAGVLVNTVTAQWTLSEIAASAASLEAVAGVASHPGIARLSSGAALAANGDSGHLMLGNQANSGSTDNDFVLDTNGLYMACVLRIPDVDETKVEFGLTEIAALPNTSVANFVGFCFDPADSDNTDDELFFAQVNAATTDTEEILTAVTYVENDWVLLELAADSTSATFRITTEDNTQTKVITTTMPTVDLRPHIAVEGSAGGGIAAEEFIDLDLFVLRYLRRDALVAGWLGA